MSLCSTNLQINLADAVISAAEASENVRISTIFSLVAVSISEIIDPMENCCPGVWRETENGNFEPKLLTLSRVKLGF